MHLLYFGCALDVVRFLHALEDEEAAKLLGWDCHSPAAESLHEHRILPVRNNHVSLFPLVSYSERNQT